MLSKYSTLLASNSLVIKIFILLAVATSVISISSTCDGAGARHLVRGSLKTWHVYIDVASPPSLAP